MLGYQGTGSITPRPHFTVATGLQGTLADGKPNTYIFPMKTLRTMVSSFKPRTSESRRYSWCVKGRESNQKIWIRKNHIPTLFLSLFRGKMWEENEQKCRGGLCWGDKLVSKDYLILERHWAILPVPFTPEITKTVKTFCGSEHQFMSRDWESPMLRPTDVLTGHLLSTWNTREMDPILWGISQNSTVEEETSGPSWY